MLQAPLRATKMYPDARAMQRKIIFHSGPTNSGKTYHAIQKYFSAKSGVYCGPLKLLAHEIFEKSNAAGVPCDLVTGEERVTVQPDGKQASHVACTVEMCSKKFKNLEKEENKYDRHDMQPPLTNACT
ncbi:ATP-dependent RNA helicase supv3l1, mitochondrial [Saguinus oedipus]|uniref:ATP-dependent RNA helicase supv3l1, mitochondrial n=1 Tax=Saguinus oedipus TaxID=9490 RepID=A0ABQ9UN83_SAGOE|nr:ATP-dependent RNA helicase supv3l1, mitochondrial [Saguinus oedipus]